MDSACLEKLPIWPEWGMVSTERDRISDQRGSGQSDYGGFEGHDRNFGFYQGPIEALEVT